MFPVKKAFRRYAIEGFAALILLGTLVRLSRTLAPQIPDPTLHAAVAFLPLLPICLFALVLLRLYLAVDEMMRHQMLVIIAGGQLLGLVVGMSYRWIPDAGLPPIQSSLFITFVCTIVAALIVAIRQLLRHRDRRDAFVLAWLAGASAAPILVYVVLAQFSILPPLNGRLAFFLFCTGFGGFSVAREFFGRNS